MGLTAQRRHWFLTIWPKKKDTCPKILLAEIERLFEALHLGFAAFQAEDAGSGLHIQAYLEVKTSIRGVTLKNKLKSDLLQPAHVEKINTSRQACRDYCSKDESRIEGTEPKFLGTFRPDHKKSVRKAEVSTCADLIKEGKSIDWIAWHRPELFLKYGTRIRDTIFYRNEYLKFNPQAAHEEEEE